MENTAFVNEETRLYAAGIVTIESASNMKLESQNDYENAGKFLVEIKTRIKQVQDYWKKPKADAASAHKTICSKEKEMLKPLTDAEAIVKRSMLDYSERIEAERRRAEDEARKKKIEESERLINAAVEAEKAGDETGVAMNMAMAEIVNDMEIAPAIAKPTAEGVSVRKSWKARVTDPQLVPAYANGFEIREIKMSVLNNLAKASQGTLKIPGVEFYLESTIGAKSKTF